MPRVRWAERCRAHRSDGEPCTAWALRGEFVCRTHGGSLTRTRQAARVRIAEVSALRMFAAVEAKWCRRMAAFRAMQIMTTADRLGIPVGEVDRAAIWACAIAHGAPPLTPPALSDVPLDRRFLAGELRQPYRAPRLREARRDR